jgi:hypothetical protein
MSPLIRCSPWYTNICYWERQDGDTEWNEQMITYPQFLFLFLFSLWDIVSFKFKCFTEIVVSFRIVNFCTVHLSFMLYSHVFFVCHMFLFLFLITIFFQVFLPVNSSSEHLKTNLLINIWIIQQTSVTVFSLLVHRLSLSNQGYTKHESLYIWRLYIYQYIGHQNSAVTKPELIIYNWYLTDISILKEQQKRLAFVTNYSKFWNTKR